jgi:hypothetical protein
MRFLSAWLGLEKLRPLGWFRLAKNPNYKFQI